MSNLVLKFCSIDDIGTSKTSAYNYSLLNLSEMLILPDE